MVAGYGPADEAALRDANRREYDRGVDPLMVLAVFEPLHDGWYFTNIGGRRVLDHVAALVPRGAEVLELCCGLGDTCRYLARHAGARVTGVELNEHQWAAGRARVAASPERAQVRLVRGDALAWPADRRFDLVLAVDALMMLPTPAPALAAARRALGPGGWLAFAEIMAGPAIDEAARGYAWEEGAIVNLPAPEEYVAALAPAGFVLAERVDWSAHAVAFFAGIAAAARARRAELAAVAGAAGAAKWIDLGERYGALFRERRFVYELVTARSVG